tara:strand:- start:2846 stop:5218 length:2373 start_codon:yes stop_codon:yes gene_type:complete
MSKGKLTKKQQPKRKTKLSKNKKNPRKDIRKGKVLKAKKTKKIKKIAFTRKDVLSKYKTIYVNPSKRNSRLNARGKRGGMNSEDEEREIARQISMNAIRGTTYRPPPTLWELIDTGIIPNKQQHEYDIRDILSLRFTDQFSNIRDGQYFLTYIINMGPDLISREEKGHLITHLRDMFPTIGNDPRNENVRGAGFPIPILELLKRGEFLLARYLWEGSVVMHDTETDPRTGEEVVVTTRRPDNRIMKGIIRWNVYSEDGSTILTWIIEKMSNYSGLTEYITSDGNILGEMLSNNTQLLAGYLNPENFAYSQFSQFLVRAFRAGEGIDINFREAGSRVNPSRRGMSALMYACKNDDFKTVEFIMSLAGDRLEINSEDEYGKTALMYAVENDSDDTLESDESSEEGASDDGSYENQMRDNITYYLLNRVWKSDTDEESGASRSKRRRVRFQARYDTVSRPTERSIQQAMSRTGSSRDMLLANLGSSQQLLRQRSRSRSGSVTSSLGAIADDDAPGVGVFGQLEEFYEDGDVTKINVNQTDNNGRTALHYAILSENTTLVNELMENGASPIMFDRDGHDAISLAVKKGKELSILRQQLRYEGEDPNSVITRQQQQVMKLSEKTAIDMLKVIFSFDEGYQERARAATELGFEDCQNKETSTVDGVTNTHVFDFFTGNLLNPAESVKVPFNTRPPPTEEEIQNGEREPETEEDIRNRDKYYCLHRAQLIAWIKARIESSQKPTNPLTNQFLWPSWIAQEYPNEGRYIENSFADVDLNGWYADRGSYLLRPEEEDEE